MTHIIRAGITLLFITTLGLSFASFGQDDAAASDVLTDKEQIIELVRSMTLWSDKNSISEGVIPNNDYSKYIGIDTSELEITLLQLEKSNFFTVEFLDNYKRIYLEIDRKLRTKEALWRVGYLSPFGHGANPWCLCQDIPYDEPNPFTEIEIETIELTETRGKFKWKWAKVDPNSDWGQRRYHFEVQKVDTNWKISALEGFDFEEYTRIKF